MSTTKCQYCQTETNNPKFCSKSCAAKLNNKTPKRKRKINYCKTCKKECGSRRTYCDICFLPEDLTLKEAIYKNHHRSSAYARIRSRARNTQKAKLIKNCEKCGYDKHVEVCHIKPISKFPMTTRISKINDDNNLLILCPNCHWEYDNL